MHLMVLLRHIQITLKLFTPTNYHMALNFMKSLGEPAVRNLTSFLPLSVAASSLMNLLAT